jgi:hypothetical protein
MFAAAEGMEEALAEEEDSRAVVPSDPVTRCRVRRAGAGVWPLIVMVKMTSLVTVSNRVLREIMVATHRRRCAIN